MMRFTESRHQIEIFFLGLKLENAIVLVARTEKYVVAFSSIWECRGSRGQCYPA